MNLAWHIGGRPAHPGSVSQIGTLTRRAVQKRNPRPTVDASRRRLRRIVAAVRAGHDTRTSIAEAVRMDPYDVGWRLAYLARQGKLKVEGRSTDARWSVA